MWENSTKVNHLAVNASASATAGPTQIIVGTALQDTQDLGEALAKLPYSVFKNMFCRSSIILRLYYHE